jgi:hypothetical protein
MAAMVFRLTAIDPPPQPEKTGAIRNSETASRKAVRRDEVFRELRGNREPQAHATRINAPEAGNSKAGRCRTPKRVARGRPLQGNSIQRLSKSHIKCKLKCDI